MKEKTGNIFPDLLKEIKNWYNGYSWNGVDFVYNPYSILLLFENLQFQNYWFQTGTPTFLLKLINKMNYTAFDLENFRLHTDIFNTYDIERLEISALLFQTGYLTIKKKDLKRNIVTLGYPNQEVEHSFDTWLITEFANSTLEKSNSLLIQMTNCLIENKIDKFVDLISILLKNVAYPLVESKELYFHSLFYLILKMVGFEIECEIMEIDGRIDAVLKTETHIYIIEFKLGDGQKALDQIKEKAYHTKYLAENRQLVLLGIGFDTEKKCIRDYKVEELIQNNI
jgi:hypothetical protein